MWGAGPCRSRMATLRRRYVKENHGRHPDHARDGHRRRLPCRTGLGPRPARGVTELVTIDGVGPFVRKKIPTVLAQRGVWSALGGSNLPATPPRRSHVRTARLRGRRPRLRARSHPGTGRRRTRPTAAERGRQPRAADLRGRSGTASARHPPSRSDPSEYYRRGRRRPYHRPRHSPPPDRHGQSEPRHHRPRHLRIRLPPNSTGSHPPMSDPTSSRSGASLDSC